MDTPKYSILKHGWDFLAIKYLIVRFSNGLALLRARLEIVRLNNAWKEPTTNSRKFPEVSGESVERDSTDQLNKEPSEPILGGENL